MSQEVFTYNTKDAKLDNDNWLGIGTIQDADDFDWSGTNITISCAGSSTIVDNRISYATIRLCNEEGEVGKLSWSKGSLEFSGDMEPSAQKFLDLCNDYFIKREQEIHQESLEALNIIAGVIAEVGVNGEALHKAMDFLLKAEYYEKRICGKR